MKYLAYIIPILFLFGCSSTKLVSTQTESSHDTTIIITPHVVTPDPIVDNPNPVWVITSNQVDSLIAHEDTSRVVIDIHNAKGKIIGKVSIKPFVGQSSVTIQPDAINYSDTNRTIKDSKTTTNNLEYQPGFFENIWNGLKGIYLIIFIAVIGFIIFVVIMKITKKTVI